MEETASSPPPVDDPVARWNARHARPDRDPDPHPNPWVREIVGALSPGRAVDLGAGRGRHALWLAGRGWQVRAVDFSPVAIELGRAVAAEAGLTDRMEWVEADVTTLELEQRSAELVLLAFLHLEPRPWRAVLAEAADAVTDGGGLLVVGHDVSNIGTDAPGPREPNVLYSTAALAGALQRCGMRIELAEVRRRRSRDTGDGVRVPTADTVVFARRA
jgi:SAM-dependent methyltransferase